MGAGTGSYNANSRTLLLYPPHPQRLNCSHHHPHLRTKRTAFINVQVSLLSWETTAPVKDESKTVNNNTHPKKTDFSSFPRYWVRLETCSILFSNLLAAKILHCSETSMKSKYLAVSFICHCVREQLWWCFTPAAERPLTPKIRYKKYFCWL